MDINKIRKQFPNIEGIVDSELQVLIDNCVRNKNIIVVKRHFKLYDYVLTSGLFLYDKTTYESYIKDKSEFKIHIRELPTILLCNGEFNTVEQIEKVIDFIITNS